MQSLSVGGDAVSGLIVSIQFARRQRKGVITFDFVDIQVLSSSGQLEEYLSTSTK
jgi:hypothetical protein